MWLWAILACAKSGSVAASTEAMTFQADPPAFGDAVVVFETRRDPKGSATTTLQPCGPLEVVAPTQGAQYRLAACSVGASSVTMPLEGPHVAALSPMLQHGSRLDVLMTTEQDGSTSTSTVLSDLEVDSRGWLQMSVADAERYAHAAAIGTLGYAVQRHPTASENPAQIDTVIPDGFRMVVAALPRGASPTPFLRPGDPVDVLTANDKRALTLLESVMCLRADRLRGDADSIGLVLPPAQAEAFMHAAHTETVRVTLRNPRDTGPASPAPLDTLELPLLSDARVPYRVDGPAAPRIREGMRGFMVDSENVDEGGTIDISGEATRISEMLVYTGAVTAAIAQRAEGHQVVLVHAWPSDAMALTLAAARHDPLLARPGDPLQ